MYSSFGLKWFVLQKNIIKVFWACFRMPEISRFMGIVIQMYYDDHSIPHIHARYSESRCKIDIEGNLMGGDIPLSKLHIIKRWINLHKSEILKNWKLIRKGKHPVRIEPWI